MGWYERETARLEQMVAESRRQARITDTISIVGGLIVVAFCAFAVIAVVMNR